jgi:hypothetical protein
MKKIVHMFYKLKVFPVREFQIKLSDKYEKCDTEAI